MLRMPRYDELKVRYDELKVWLQKGTYKSMKKENKSCHQLDLNP